MTDPEAADEPRSATTHARRLVVAGLTVAVKGSDVEIVQDVSLSVDAGEVVGVVGESGSGKTTLGLALMGHVRRGLQVTAGQSRFEGTDLLRLPDKQLRLLHGSALAYVPQEPGAALDPARRVGPQLVDSLTSHGRTAAEADARVAELLPEVGLDASAQVLNRYPHQLSGGQLQRVVIAMAFACRPKVIVLDEPTTGLDVTTQRRVLDTVETLCAHSGVAVVYITHDIAVVAQMADRLAVMYSGRIVELGRTEQILASPTHPYTDRLLAAVPSMDEGATMQGIPGAPPRPSRRPPGCAFAPRCMLRVTACDEAVPPLIESGADGQLARCVRSGRGIGQASAGARAAARPQRTTPPVAPGPTARAGASVLAVESISAWYGARRVLWDVDLTVAPAQCLAIVGESGSGKTTLARCIVGLHAAWTGALQCMGSVLKTSARERPLADLRRLQYVFQNPYASLNPRRTIGALLAQPLAHFCDYDRAEIARRVVLALAAVSLPSDLVSRYPDQLSGGERQRVAIARALIVSPELLICDEVTSALDVSVQASVVAMLLEAMHERQMAMLFITHDLTLASCIARDVVVLHDGRCVDAGPMERVIRAPQDEYTARLLEDVPTIPVARASYQQAGLDA